MPRRERPRVQLTPEQRAKLRQAIESAPPSSPLTDEELDNYLNEAPRGRMRKPTTRGKPVTRKNGGKVKAKSKAKTKRRSPRKK